MFVLGHVGIGPRLLGPLRARLPAVPLVVGCLLPDLIDKPLFYLNLALTGRGPDQQALLRGSRGLGHTGLFLLALLLAAALARSRLLWAVAAGVATHFALDLGGELLTGADPESSIWLALLFPAFGGRLPRAHFGSILEHLLVSAQSLSVLAGEAVGGAILLWELVQRRRRAAAGQAGVSDRAPVKSAQ